VAVAVKIPRLPGLPPLREKHGEDISDWLDAGHTREELEEILKNTPKLEAKDLSVAATSSREKPLQWYTIAQLREETSAEIKFLADGLLAESSLSVIGGKIAVGKSTLARTLAYCVTHGLPFLERATRQGAVLYVAPEESTHGVMQDLLALGFTDNDPLHLCFASSENVLEQVLTKMQETHARLVIFETIFRVLRIKDANDYAQATHRLDPVLELARKTSAHVLFTHHLGKRDTVDAIDSLLGSTAIGGTPDTRIIIKKKGDVRTIEVIQRYGRPIPETVLHYDPETRFITAGETLERAETINMKESIADFLKMQPEPVCERDIKEGLDGNNRHKQTALRELVAEGRVERQGIGKKGDPYKFSLAHFSIGVKCESEHFLGGVRPQESATNSHFSNSPFFEQSRSEKSENPTSWEEEL
jgi:hypothetical protein